MSSKLLSCMEADADRRDDEWFETTLAEVPLASFLPCSDGEVANESGLPFLAVRPIASSAAAPEPDSSGFTALSEQAIARGEGIVIFPTDEPGPKSLSLSFGELWSFREYGCFDGTDEFLQEPSERSDNQVLIGFPAEGLFSDYARDAIRRFFQQLGLEEPKVLVVNDPQSTFSCSLVFNVFADDFESDEEFDELMNTIVWHLPRGIGLVGVSSDTFDPESYQAF